MGLTSAPDSHVRTHHTQFADSPSATTIGRNDTVIEAEFRRRSGRGVSEWFYFSSPTDRDSSSSSSFHAPADSVGDDSKTATRSSGAAATSSRTTINANEIILLDDHPLFRPPSSAAAGGDDASSGASANQGANDTSAQQGLSTFDLGLTVKQRRDREGVVLPYFDAQRRGAGGVDVVGGGGGEGGRILYDLGSEDDFDEEEDEI